MRLEEVEALTSGRLQSPSAERNKAVIAEILSPLLSDASLVLEVASGTGQHVVHFARVMPAITWQPSECDDECLRSISAWLALEAPPNVRAPLRLDVHDAHWPPVAANAIVAINMIHIAPHSATVALLRGAGAMLHEGGLLYLYGPFRLRGTHISASNRVFDQQLQAANAAWGVRDLDEVVSLAREAGFGLQQQSAMPAHNLSVVFRRSARPRSGSGPPRVGAG